MTRLAQLLSRLAPILLLMAVAVIVSACAAGTNPGASGGASPSFSQAPLAPAQLKASPFDLLAWLFTPIFQTLFIGLVLLDKLTYLVWPETGNIVLAIILLTVVLKILTTPITRKQLISSRQTQLLQPEIKEIQRKYKGDRVKANEATQEFYKQRGINPAGGCLPTVLTMGLLIPMYSVFSSGLTNHDIRPILHVFGFDLASALNITCDRDARVRRGGARDQPVPEPVLPRHRLGAPGAGHHGPRRSRASGSASSRSSRRSCSWWPVARCSPRWTRGSPTTPTSRCSARWPTSCR